jgi:hypothetical protein
VPFCHCPLAVQVCGMFPEHCWAPWEQATHWPAVQTIGQAVDDCHSPADVQVRGMLPLQLCVPGAQTPVQLPWLQTNGQADPPTQAPSALHI